MIIIGLHGKAGAGKDTAAEHLWKRWRFARYALATPIREGLEHMLSVLELGNAFRSRERKEQPLPYIGKSPRELMQTLGTEWGRQLVHDRLWLIIAEHVLAKVAEDHARGDLAGIVITDIRFPNEAEWIRQLGGEVWHIVRNSTGDVRAHSSETQLPRTLIDRTIPNHSSLSILRVHLNTAAADLIGTHHTEAMQ